MYLSGLLTLCMILETPEKFSVANSEDCYPKIKPQKFGITKHFISVYNVCYDKYNLQGLKYMFIWNFYPVEGPFIIHYKLRSSHKAPQPTISVAGFCLLLFFNSLLSGKFFRIIPEFRILRMTFHRKSSSKC